MTAPSAVGERQPMLVIGKSTAPQTLKILDNFLADIEARRKVG